MEASPVKKRTKILCAAALAVLIGAAAALIPRTSTAQRVTTAMGSIVTQTVYGRSERALTQTTIQAAQTIQQLENRISCKLDASEISALNRTGTAEVSADTAALLTQLTALQQASNGRYCITMRPLTLLWDFDAAEFRVPSAEALRDAVSQSGGLCAVDGCTVRLTRGTIDLGSAGKGAACDAAVAVYRADDAVSSAVVAVGGSVGLYGQKGRDPWVVAIRDPDGSAADTLGTLSLSAGFVSTSGTYEKVRTSGGARYHHLLDPATGYPAETDLVSATVVCDSGALSDALATACVVMGSADGAALLQSYGAEYVLIDVQHQITVSAGLRDRFTLTASAYTLRESM